MAGSCFHPRPRMGSVGVAKDIYLEKFGLDATIFSLLVGNLPLDFLWFEMQVVWGYTPENEHSPWKGTIPKGKLIFQPSFFRGCVNFRGSRTHENSNLQVDRSSTVKSLESLYTPPGGLCHGDVFFWCLLFEGIWLAGTSTHFQDVFPIEHGHFPMSC